jgi:hypothetical protein
MGIRSVGGGWNETGNASENAIQMPVARATAAFYHVRAGWQLASDLQPDAAGG